MNERIDFAGDIVLVFSSLHLLKAGTQEISTHEQVIYTLAEDYSQHKKDLERRVKTGRSWGLDKPVRGFKPLLTKTFDEHCRSNWETIG